jgi:hypothetical protein
MTTEGPMRVADALDQIDAIHEQLAKGETYRGFRAPGVAAAGVVGMLAAVAQPWLVDDPGGFLAYWSTVAVACAVLAAGAGLYAHWFREDAYARRRSGRLMGQFLPCILAGAALTAAAPRAGLVPYLPGLWATVFALGVFAARPYLPRATGWVGLFYLSAGAWLLWREPSGLVPAGWEVGGVFGFGHLLTAFVLDRNVERTDD